jgi:hypothetical protein
LVIPVTKVRIVRDAVPDALRFILERFGAAGLQSIVPAVEPCRLDAQLLHRPAHWQVGLLDQANDLQLFHLV